VRVVVDTNVFVSGLINLDWRPARALANRRSEPPGPADQPVCSWDLLALEHLPTRRAERDSGSAIAGTPRGHIAISGIRTRVKSRPLTSTGSQRQSPRGPADHATLSVGRAYSHPKRPTSQGLTVQLSDSMVDLMLANAFLLVAIVFGKPISECRRIEIDNECITIYKLFFRPLRINISQSLYQVVMNKSEIRPYRFRLGNQYTQVSPKVYKNRQGLSKRLKKHISRHRLFIEDQTV